MSIIVYGQHELDKAIRAGISRITLCAGIFNMPKCANIVFDRIGPVKVFVSCTKEEADNVGMVFHNIYPEYKPGGTRKETRVPMRGSMSGSGSGGSSGAGLGYGIDLI